MSCGGNFGVTLRPVYSKIGCTWTTCTLMLELEVVKQAYVQYRAACLKFRLNLCSWNPSRSSRCSLNIVFVELALRKMKDGPRESPVSVRNARSYRKPRCESEGACRQGKAEEQKMLRGRETNANCTIQTISIIENNSKIVHVDSAIPKKRVLANSCRCAL